MLGSVIKSCESIFYDIVKAFLNKVISGDVQTETRQVLTNIRTILEGCGASMSDVVRCGVFLGDANDFAPMNAVYAEFFGDAKPARATVVTGFAVPGIHVEIEAIAYQPK